MAQRTSKKFEALVARLEDIEDAQALRAAAARFEPRDALPLAMVKRLRAGEHPLRVWRERRGLTLLALAKKAGVPVSYLSEIESGKKPGSVEAFRKAAAAIGVDIDDLIPVPDDANRIARLRPTAPKPAPSRPRRGRNGVG
jgi:DNA-binding XRE family transcriptional regulator